MAYPEPPPEGPDPDDDDSSALDFWIEADVVCPYCGETTTIALDRAAGAEQEYVEDCQVCCRPWQVRVHFDESGTPEVQVEPS